MIRRRRDKLRSDAEENTFIDGWDFIGQIKSSGFHIVSAGRRIGEMDGANRIRKTADAPASAVHIDESTVQMVNIEQ